MFVQQSFEKYKRNKCACTNRLILELRTSSEKEPGVVDVFRKNSMVWNTTFQFFLVIFRPGIIFKESSQKISRKQQQFFLHLNNITTIRGHSTYLLTTCNQASERRLEQDKNCEHLVVVALMIIQLNQKEERLLSVSLSCLKCKH